VNANGKILDVWMLICCELCGRTPKIPIHERASVQALESERLLMFENNDLATVRELAMDGTLARSCDLLEQPDGQRQGESCPGNSIDIAA
jgi:hypothetical protein